MDGRTTDSLKSSPSPPFSRLERPHFGVGCTFYTYPKHTDGRTNETEQRIKYVKGLQNMYKDTEHGNDKGLESDICYELNFSWSGSSKVFGEASFER